MVEKWSITTWPTKTGWRVTWSRGHPLEDEEKALNYLRRAIKGIELERAAEKLVTPEANKPQKFQEKDSE